MVYICIDLLHKFKANFFLEYFKPSSLVNYSNTSKGSEGVIYHPHACGIHYTCLNRYIIPQYTVYLQPDPGNAGIANQASVSTIINMQSRVA